MDSDMSLSVVVTPLGMKTKRRRTMIILEPPEFNSAVCLVVNLSLFQNYSNLKVPWVFWGALVLLRGPVFMIRDPFCECVIPAEEHMATWYTPSILLKQSNVPEEEET